MNIKTFTLSQVSKLIKNALEFESLLKSIAIIGEISNLKYHASGHIYLTLKDESDVLSCVMFKRSADLLPYKLENGMKVIAIGEVNYYEKNGQITLIVEAIIPQGEGVINIALEELKEKLKKKGYFDYKNKKVLPKFPEKVVVITSSTGAVIEDIKNVASRRNKNIEIVVCPVKVQGLNSENIVSNAIKYINKHNAGDVIIIARGGGSSEDLKAFNTEILANAVFKSNIPIVSAVGHETDTTICDMVSDVRASTPSEAAEIVFPLTVDMQNILNFYYEQLNKSVEDKVENYRLRINHIKEFEIYNKSKFFVDINKKNIEIISKELEELVNKKAENNKSKMLINSAKLEKYNPISIINQGYVLAKKDKVIVESVKEINIDDMLYLGFKDGEVLAEVKDIKSK